jgi:hypothetical protein
LISCRFLHSIDFGRELIEALAHRSSVRHEPDIF